jgi:hypothetical protein
MISEENYIEAKRIVDEYEKQQLDKPVLDHEKFLNDIKERESMCSEALEFVGYLSYDLNPIGGRKDMFNSMKKNALEQIIEIRSKLDQIRKSLCE